MRRCRFFCLRLIIGIVGLGVLGIISGCASYRAYTQAEMLYNQGLREGAVTNFKEAASLLEQAGRLYSESGSKASEGEAYRMASLYYGNLGNYQRSIELAKKALNIQLEVRDNVLLQGRAYIQLGHNYYWLVDYEKAEEYYLKALEILLPYKERGIGHDKVSFKWYISQIYRMLGFIKLNRGKPGLALEDHLKELELINEVHLEKLRGSPLVFSPRADSFRDMTWAHRDIAEDYRRLKKFDRALEHYQKALSYARHSTDKKSMAYALMGIGDISLNQGDYARAKKAYQESMELVKKYHLKGDEVWLLQRLAKLYRTTGDYEKAVEFYKDAVTFVEEIRGELKIEEEKTSFLKNKLFIYEELILILLNQNREEEAFQYVERARSRALLDMLGNRVKLGKTKDAALGAREQELNKKIERLLNKLSKEESKPEKEQHRDIITQTSRQLERLRGEYQTLLIDIKQQSPELASLVSVDPLKLPEIQALTGGDFTLLEYYVTEKETLLWVVNKEAYKLVRIPIYRQDLETKVEVFRNLIIKRAEIKELQASSQGLYDLLLSPALPYVKSKTLCLVPHGVLHYLPFQALQDEKGQYMMQKYALFYSSSASVLKFTFQKRKESSNKLLALGNPDLGNTAFALPFAEEEVKEIGRYFPQKEILVKSEATKKRAQNDSPAYDLLHFACHGDLQEFSPMFSALRLAPSGEGQDGRLEVHEIFNLELNASLVTLSACKTGLGKLKTGDELIGLTRAFIYAGTPAVVASLWAVEDRSTYLLMSKFYQHLKTKPKAEALRAAQLEVAKEYPQPFFWAAFTLAGDWK